MPSGSFTPKLRRATTRAEPRLPVALRRRQFGAQLVARAVGRTLVAVAVQVAQQAPPLRSHNHLVGRRGVLLRLRIVIHVRQHGAEYRAPDQVRRPVIVVVVVMMAVVVRISVVAAEPGGTDSTGDRSRAAGSSSPHGHTTLYTDSRHRGKGHRDTDSPA